MSGSRLVQVIELPSIILYVGLAVVLGIAYAYSAALDMTRAEASANGAAAARAAAAARKAQGLPSPGRPGVAFIVMPGTAAISPQRLAEE